MSVSTARLTSSKHTKAAQLFTPLKIRDITLRNRIAVSPMCQYSCEDRFANDWHLVHLGSRAVGGAALVIAEASAVEARGRISPWDLGIWKDEHIEPLARIAHFVKEHGSIPAIQLTEAGRKASTDTPWRGGHTVPVEGGGWRQFSARIDSSTGWISVPFSEEIRRKAGILTGAVGLITEPAQAEAIIRDGEADLILMAREFLREPYWPIKAAQALGVKIPIAVQYARAFPNPAG